MHHHIAVPALNAIPREAFFLAVRRPSRAIINRYMEIMVLIQKPCECYEAAIARWPQI